MNKVFPVFCILNIIFLLSANAKVESNNINDGINKNIQNYKNQKNNKNFDNIDTKKFKKMDMNSDGVVTYEEFKLFSEEKRRKRKKVFKNENLIQNNYNK